MIQVLLISLIIGLIGSSTEGSDSVCIKYFSSDSDRYQSLSPEELYYKLDKERKLNDEIIKIYRYNSDHTLKINTLYNLNDIFYPDLLILETESGYYYSIECIKDKIYIQITKKSEDVSKWKERVINQKGSNLCYRKIPEVYEGASIKYALGELLQDALFKRLEIVKNNYEPTNRHVYVGKLKNNFCNNNLLDEDFNYSPENNNNELENNLCPFTSYENSDRTVWQKSSNNNYRQDIPSY